MPLFDHLGELRMRLVRIVACLSVAVVVFYLASPTIAHFMTIPIAQYLPHDANGVAIFSFIDPFEAFTVRFTISLWASIVACMPIIIWQVMGFFLPALRPSERIWFIPTFAVAVGLFIFGTVFCYLIILNHAFEWLTDQGAGFGETIARATTYVDTIIRFEIGFGLAFELPLVVFFLVILDLVPYKKLRESWRVVYVSLMILAAITTPDASPITMLLMVAALIGLYEISLFIARLALGKRIKSQNRAYELQKAEDEKWNEEYKAMKRAKKEARK